MSFKRNPVRMNSIVKLEPTSHQTQANKFTHTYTFTVNASCINHMRQDAHRNNMGKNNVKR